MFAKEPRKFTLSSFTCNALTTPLTTAPFTYPTSVEPKIQSTLYLREYGMVFMNDSSVTMKN